MLLGSRQKRCHISSETSNISSNALIQSPRLSLAFRSWITLLSIFPYPKSFSLCNSWPPPPPFFFSSPHNYNFQVIMKTATALNSFWRIILTSVTKMIGKKELINLYKINLMIILICYKFYCYKEEPKNNHKTNLMEEKVDSAHTFFFFFCSTAIA